jgi:hypothetical protein
MYSVLSSYLMQNEAPVHSDTYLQCGVRIAGAAGSNHCLARPAITTQKKAAVIADEQLA